MSATDRTSATAPADLTSPTDGPDLAPAGGGLPVVDPVGPLVLDPAVDSVDLGAGAPLSSSSTSTSGRGTGACVPRPAPTVETVDSADSGPGSTPREVDPGGNPYAEGGKWHYAEQIKGRIFTITTDCVHPDTGEVLLTVETIEKRVAKSSVEYYAWVLHDKDCFTESDVEGNPRAVLGEHKPDHFHIVVQLKNQASVGQVARGYKLHPGCVRKKEGQGTFLDCIEYLTHEHEKQQRLGKHLYGDEEIHSNFDWRTAVDERVAARKQGFHSGSAAKKMQIRLAVMNGEMTLKQVREDEPGVYVQDLEKLQKLQQDFRLHQPAPRYRTNYFIGGMKGDERKGRTGKTQLAKLFARSLFRDLDADECYYVATDPRVPLQNYKGQPVIIWDDYNALDLMEALGGRSGVWQVFDDHPSAGDVNIKYGATRLVHTVNIITKTTPYAQFLDGLAGEYTDKSGKHHKAEDRNQSWGRFPVVFEVTIDSIEMLLNRGFVDDTDDFLAYQKVARMRASMRQVCAALDSIQDDAEREAAAYQIGDVLLRPMLDQHAKLQPVASRKGADVVGELLAGIEVIDGDEIARREVAGQIEARASLVDGEELRRQAVAERSRLEIAATKESVDRLRSAGFYELPDAQRHDIIETLAFRDHRLGQRVAGGAA